MSDQEAAHPSDVTGLPFEAPTGELEGRATLADSLGLLDTVTKDVPAEKGGQEQEQTGDKPESSQKPKAGENNLVDQYGEFIQRNAEEAYAYALNRAKSDDAYLDKLVQSKDPIDQRLATKLLSRNDFGAKTPAEYRRSLRLKEAGDDPKERRLIELENRLDELQSGTQTRDWSSWKKENAVSGEAETLADQVRAEYPQMPNADVLAFVRGKLGITQTPTQKERMGFVRGGLGAVPEEDTPDMESPLARALLPKDIKKTQAFGRQLFGKRR